ncbi:hypothetical protein Dxin01_03946 [Deinococcus xinjiangensis]|uniref:DinB-like domain-containing protein n=2 Tax=Deinococcus xinjiangensis TaxID=457454 RepID=A0ABP9VG50_9DEIO
MTSRLHRYLLGALPLPSIPPHGAAFTSATIEPAALSTFRSQLDTPGWWTMGNLFGHIADDVLHITHASIGGYPVWRPLPLTGDDHYQLGYIDALQSTVGPHIDWTGHWITRPDAQLPTIADSSHWLQAGAGQGLFSAVHVLFAVGFFDHRLEVEGYRIVDGRIEMLPVQLSVD